MNNEQTELIAKILHLKSQLDSFLLSGECSTMRAEVTIELEREIDELLNTLDSAGETRL